MRKRNLSLLVFALLGSGLTVGCSNIIKPSSPTKYEIFAAYRIEGGTLSYFEWIKAGCPEGPNTPKKKEEKREVASKYYDERGHLIIVFKDGTKIDAGIAQCKHSTVNFYYDDVLLTSKEISFGSKIKEPAFGSFFASGWFLDKELIKPADFDAPVLTEKLDLYARCEAKKNESIVNFYDGTLNLRPFPKKIAIGEEYELPSLVDMNSKLRFEGWYYEGQKVDLEGKWKIIDHVTLVARWREKEAFEEDYFGLYPQSAVIDKKTSDDIDKYGVQYFPFGNKENGDIIEYGGEWYRKRTVSGERGTYSDYRLHDGSKVENGRTYYLKFEPVKWIKKTLKSGETIAFSKNVFDNYYFVYDIREVRKKGDVTVSNNDYRYSVMRSYINEINGREEFGPWGWDFSRSNGKGLGSLRFFLNEKENNVLTPHDKCYGDKVFLPSKEECEECLGKEEMIAEKTDELATAKKLETTKATSYATRSASEGNTDIVYVNDKGEFATCSAEKRISFRLAVRIK